MNKFISALLVALVGLVIVNIVATVGVMKKVDKILPTDTASKTIENPLPESITKDVVGDIFTQFEKAFNSHDFDTFYGLFSPFAQSQMKREELVKTYSQLIDYFDEVSNGVFSHYEFNGQQGNMKAYNLNYIVDLGEESKFGGKGKARITITWDGKEYGIVSTFISSYNY